MGGTGIEGSDVGPLWSQGLERTSISIGCFGETKIEGSQRKRHCLERSLEEYLCRFLFFLYLLGSDVGSLWSQILAGTSVSIGCGRALFTAFTVARIRRNFCQYRMRTRMSSSTCICWAPMWDHYSRKD